MGDKMDKIFFIDLAGQIIENPEIASHIGLAIDIINKNDELKQQFSVSGYDKQDLFLVENVGYTLGSATEYDKFLIINKEKATKAQKQTAFRFVQEGYSYYFSNGLNNPGAH